MYEVDSMRSRDVGIDWNPSLLAAAFSFDGSVVSAYRKLILRP